MIYFRHAKHYKYAFEAFSLLAHVHVLASPGVQHQLMWSRVVNTRCGEGKNVPVDLHNEHLNRKLKDVVSGVGANITEDLIVEASKLFECCIDTILCEHFDTMTGIRPDSLHHTKKTSQQDLETIVKQLSDLSRRCFRTHQAASINHSPILHPIWSDVWTQRVFLSGYAKNKIS